MCFKRTKESVQDIPEACPLMSEERKNKSVVCDYLALVAELIYLVDEFTQEYLDKMKQLRYEIEYNLLKVIKKLDPDFPWEDSFTKEENENDIPQGMYEILKEHLEDERS